MLLTKIPHFNDEILMSFSCPHCQYENCNVQSASEVQAKGIKFTLHIGSSEDLNRAIKVSDSTTFRIEDFDIEKLHSTGQVSNVEGILRQMAEGLQLVHGGMPKTDSERSLKISDHIWNIGLIQLGDLNVTITLDDPAGNAWLEPLPTDTESKFTRISYERTSEQDQQVGIGASQDSESLQQDTQADFDEELGGITASTLSSLYLECPYCKGPAMVNYHTMDIPHFKEIVISAINCTDCGYRTNDVTSGGAVPDRGKRISLKVKQPSDLNRDVLKSESCAATIPEFEVNMGPGTMGARFTTVEGLLTQARDDLRRSAYSVGEDGADDAVDPEEKATWDRLFDRLDKAIKGELGFTLILEDPLANSYVQSLNAPDPDPNIQEEEYERTKDEIEELGLADMKTRLDADGEYVAE